MIHASEKKSIAQTAAPATPITLASLRASIQQVGLSAGLELWAEKETMAPEGIQKSRPTACLAVYEKKSGGDARYYVCLETGEDGRLNLIIRDGPRRKRLGFGWHKRQTARDKLIKKVIEDAAFWCMKA